MKFSLHHSGHQLSLSVSSNDFCHQVARVCVERISPQWTMNEICLRKTRHYTNTRHFSHNSMQIFKIPKSYCFCFPIVIVTIGYYCYCYIVITTIVIVIVSIGSPFYLMFCMNCLTNNMHLSVPLHGMNVVV